PKKEWDEDLTDAERRVRVMYVMIENMALYAEHATSAVERVNLHDLVDGGVRDVRQHFKVRGERAHVQIDNHVDPTLELDAPRDLLSRALVNVIKNAVEHVDADSGCVAIGAHASAQDATRVLVVVADDGPGF